MCRRQRVLTMQGLEIKTYVNSATNRLRLETEQLEILKDTLGNRTLGIRENIRNQEHVYTQVCKF